MKLVDILARGLEHWPNGAEFAVQDGDKKQTVKFAGPKAKPSVGLFGQENVWQSRSWDFCRYGLDFDSPNLAEDWEVAKVTRAEWQAAVDLLKNPAALDIDWSSAPADSTHVAPWANRNPWRKFDGSKWFVWACNSWHKLNALPETYIARPHVDLWNGEGLPPVGTDCEMFVESEGIWVRGVIVAHCVLRQGPTAVAHDHERCWHGIVGDFRPIRTPVQLAADKHRLDTMAELNRLWDADAKRSDFLEAVYAMILDGRQP